MGMDYFTLRETDTVDNTRNNRKRDRVKHNLCVS